jgi:hypothetical protein
MKISISSQKEGEKNRTRRLRRNKKRRGMRKEE